MLLWTQVNYKYSYRALEYRSEYMNIVQAEVSESIQKSQVIYYAIKLIVLNKLDIEVNEASNKQKVKWKGINNHSQHNVF